MTETDTWLQMPGMSHFSLLFVEAALNGYITGQEPSRVIYPTEEDRRVFRALFP